MLSTQMLSKNHPQITIVLRADRTYGSFLWFQHLLLFIRSLYRFGHSVSIHGSSLQKYRHRAVFNKLYKSCLLLAQMLCLHITWKLLYTWNNCLVCIFIILSPAMSWGLGNLTTSKCSLPLISCVHALWCQLWWFSHGVGWQRLSSILIGGLHVMIKEHKVHRAAEAWREVHILSVSY